MVTADAQLGQESFVNRLLLMQAHACPALPVRTSSQVIDCHESLLLVTAIRQGCCCGLVDDTQHIKTCSTHNQGRNRTVVRHRDSVAEHRVADSLLLLLWVDECLQWLVAMFVSTATATATATAVGALLLSQHRVSAAAAV